MTTESPTTPEQGDQQPRRFQDVVRRQRPNLGILMPRFPGVTALSKAARSQAWIVPGWPIASIPVTALLAVIISIWAPHAPTVTYWTWQAVKLAATNWRPSTILVIAAAFVWWNWHRFPKDWQTNFTKRRFQTIGGTMFAAVAYTVYNMASLVPALIAFAAVVCWVVDFYAAVIDRKWRLRRYDCSIRRRWPMLWAIVAGKTGSVQAGAVGGGEATLFENVGGGRPELDHPAMSISAIYDIEAFTSTRDVSAPPGRDQSELIELAARLAASDDLIKSIDFQFKDNSSTWGKMVIAFNDRGSR